LAYLRSEYGSGIGGEQLAQVQLPDSSVVRFESLQAGIRKFDCSAGKEGAYAPVDPVRTVRASDWLSRISEKWTQPADSPV
jgi:hypothetical protein